MAYFPNGAIEAQVAKAEANDVSADKVLKIQMFDVRRKYRGEASEKGTPKLFGGANHSWCTRSVVHRVFSSSTATVTQPTYYLSSDVASAIQRRHRLAPVVSHSINLHSQGSSAVRQTSHLDLHIWSAPPTRQPFLLRPLGSTPSPNFPSFRLSNHQTH